MSPQQDDFITDVLSAAADDSSYFANAYTGTFSFVHVAILLPVVELTLLQTWQNVHVMSSQ